MLRLVSKRVVAAEFSGKSFADALDKQMQHFIDKAEKGVNKADLPSFVFEQDPNSFDRFIFRFTSWDEIGRADLQASECLEAGIQICESRLQSLGTAIEQYKKPYQALTKRHHQLRMVSLSRNRPLANPTGCCAHDRH